MRVFSRYMINVAHDFIDIDHHAKVSGVYDGRPFFLALYFLGLLLSFKSRGMSLRYPIFLVFSRRPHLRVRSRKRFPSLMPSA